MKINFLGDSITEGWGSSNLATKGFVPLVGNKLNCTVNNYGIGATRIAAQTLPYGMPINDKFFITRVDDMDKDADLVFIFGGTNDFGHGDAPMGKFDDKTNYTFYGAISNLIEKLLSIFDKDKIVFITPLHRYGEDDPWGDHCYQGKVITEPLSKYVEVIKEMCAYYKVECINFDNVFKTPLTCNDEGLFVDGLHPNDKGHEALANEIVKYVKTRF